jgi:hypothetical protein
MGAGSLNNAEVKSVCDGLECSPSANSKPAPSGGKAKLIRHAASPAASGSTGDFTMSRQSGKIPGYKTGFARGARQE